MSQIFSGFNALPLQALEAIAARYVVSDAQVCVENQERCAGTKNIEQALESLQTMMLYNYDECVHRLKEPAPRMEDSLLVDLAEENLENAVYFLRNDWPCARKHDVVAALTELRTLLEDKFEAWSTANGGFGLAAPT